MIAYKAKILLIRIVSENDNTLLTPLPANIRLEWNWLIAVKTLAYGNNCSHKRFIVQARDDSFTKLYLLLSRNELECFSLTRIFILA
jgi:hypothetical protein